MLNLVAFVSWNLGNVISPSLAINWVAPGGRIVAIVPDGLLPSQSKKRRDFRESILTSVLFLKFYE